MNEALLKQVESFLETHREAAIDVIRQLVAIDSTKSEAKPGAPFGEGNRKVLEQALTICEQLGFQTYNHEGYCGSAVWGSGENEIGIFSHLDVVPVGEGWTGGPFEMQVEGDRLIGRGVADNKGGFAAGLYAMYCIKQLGIPLKHSLRLFMGCDEESGMEDVEYFLTQVKAPEFSIVPDTGFPVCHGEKGILEGNICAAVNPEKIKVIQGGKASNVVPDLIEIRLEDLKSEEIAYLIQKAESREWIKVMPQGLSLTIEARGISAHAAAPQDSVNAIYQLATFLNDEHVLTEKERKLFDFIEEILSDYQGKALGIDYTDEDSGSLTAICGMLEQVGETVKLNFNVRYPVTDSAKRIIPQLECKCRSNGYGVEVLTASDPMYLPKEHPMVTQLVELYHEMTGQEAAPYIMGGGTYARKLPQAVGFGPGCGALFPRAHQVGRGGGHQPDEEANIAELLHAAKIYVMAFLILDEL